MGILSRQQRFILRQKLKEQFRDQRKKERVRDLGSGKVGLDGRCARCRGYLFPLSLAKRALLGPGEKKKKGDGGAKIEAWSSRVALYE